MILITLAVGCASQQPPRATPPPSGPREVERGTVEKGLASWYGEPYHGRRTASGEVYDMHAMTAAHRTLAFGTVVKVTRRDTGADVRVRINDRGPFIRGRIIDLSFAAARRIGLDHDGVAPVKVVVTGFEQTPKKKAEKKTPTAEHPAGEDCFWVQVGAFGDLANARRAEQRLEDAGETAVIIEGPGGLHRVRVGPFVSAKQADDALERIRPDWPVAAIVSCG